MSETNADRNKSSINVRPTEPIYPVQAPYGDIHGLTPPPEDFEELLQESSSLVYSKPFDPSKEPPTPPRTEAVSSPARSSLSGGSPPGKLGRPSPESSPTSPASDAVMEHEMDFDDLTPDPLSHDFIDASATDLNPQTTSATDNDIDAMLDINDFTNDNPFFDFNSAASSPKPPMSSLALKSHQPRYFQSSFDNPPPFQTTPQRARRHMSNEPQSRKRSRDEQEALSLGSNSFLSTARSSPSADVKVEYNQNAQNFGFRNLGSLHTFTGTGFTTPFLTSEISLPQVNGLGQFMPKFRFNVDFPKHSVRLPSGFGEVQVKSRVETQIAVRFIASPAPDNVTKLRLPRHAISKIKYIEDGHPPNSPDTLELQTALVCASAMNSKDQLERALCEARGEAVPAWVLQEQAAKLAMEKTRMEAARLNPDGLNGEGVLDNKQDDRRQKIDYTKPLFGANVQICEQCMNRERKRAGRKKNKKPEEEERWAQDESKRIIVFNTNQVRQFEPFPGVADSSVIAAETQMRICCYCRHHGEKDGFRVIFTLKDHTGTVVAQTISSTIVITDDHKNTAATAANVLSPSSSHSDASIPIPTVDPANQPSQLPNYAPPTYGTPGVQPTQEVLATGPNFSAGFPNKPLSNGHCPSPPAPARGNAIHHQPKRRKGSKVPSSLAMTPADASPYNQAQFQSPGMSFTSRPDVSQPWITSPVTPMAQPEDNYFNNMRWSPGMESNQSYEAVKSPAIQMASAPNNQKMFSRQMGTGMLGPQNVQFSQQSIPQVGRVVPSEGTCRGGIEITILGRDFVNGLTVMFGDIPATDTSFYSDTTLLCRLPPNPVPGAVVVSLKNLDASFRPDAVPLFTYVDDVDKELMALALTVVGMKMKGEVGTSKQIALSILRDNGIGSEAIESTRNGSGGNQRADLESTFLTCLDVIDMDESPHPASLAHKNRSGQTMLHLACIMGMPKFVAALLARGVNVNMRDRNGYTPLHFAALYKRSDVVRRLLMNGANPGLRTRGGDTAADLGESEQIVRATRSAHSAHSAHQIHSGRHSRSSSVSSESRFGKSRSNSVSSLHAFSLAMTRDSVDDFYDSSDEQYSGDEADGNDGVEMITRKLRRSSVQEQAMGAKSVVPDLAAASIVKEASPANGNAATNTGPLSPPAIMAAWMDAWREQLTHSLQNLQLNMPTIPMAVDYQNMFQNHMARFQNPMPRWNNFKPPFVQQRDDPNYKWSELFHPPAPPAYDELFPDGNQAGGSRQDTKIQPVEDEQVVTSSSAMEPSSSRSSSPPIDLRELHRRITLGGPNLTQAQQDEYRAHIRKMKRIESDRRLYFFWIPVLILILTLMAFNRGPTAWATGKQVYSFAKQVVEEPAAVRERLRLIAARALGVSG